MQMKWMGTGAVLLLGGCASVEMAQYTVTSFAEIPLKEKATIKVVAGDDSVSSAVTTLTEQLGKTGAFSVVDENANYWFILNGAEQYVKSAPQNTFSVQKQENESGGQEVVVASTRNLASAAKGVNVAVYDAKPLAPVHYFDIPVYSGDNTEGDVRSEQAYLDAFAKETVERVMDAFVTQQKQVETPMPLEADSDLRKAFAKGGELAAKGTKNAYAEFLKCYKTKGVIDLAKLCEQLRTETYEGSDAKVKLGNYYLYLLAKEAMTLDPEALKKLRSEHLMMLQVCDADGLAEAIPVALARLEYKLANLGE